MSDDRNQHHEVPCAYGDILNRWMFWFDSKASQDILDGKTTTEAGDALRVLRNDTYKALKGRGFKLCKDMSP